MTLLEQLLLHEGLRLKPYKDTVGELTIGVGRALHKKGLSKEEALYLLQNDIDEATALCRKHLPVFSRLNETRQRVLIDMAFNLGLGGLMGFKTMLAALERGDFEAASVAMLESKWAEQVGRRAYRLAQWMREGEMR